VGDRLYIEESQYTPRTPHETWPRIQVRGRHNNSRQLSYPAAVIVRSRGIVKGCQLFGKFLGDFFFSASDFLFFSFPTLQVGERFGLGDKIREWRFALE
jgi:hypothetical protein